MPLFETVDNASSINPTRVLSKLRDGLDAGVRLGRTLRDVFKGWELAVIALIATQRFGQ